MKYLKFIFLVFFVGLYTTVMATNEKILNVGIGYKGRSYDPHKHTDSATLAITKQIYNNLFILENDGKIKNELASSYKVDKDKNIIIDIKKGIKFQNSEELDAESVVKSLERNMKNPVTHVLVQPIKKVEVVDKNTIKIVQTGNPEILLHNLAHSSLAIVKEDRDGKLFGTGPFKLKSWGNGEKVELVSNKEYFKGTPKIDGVNFISIPENANRLIALEVGEIQIAYDLSAIDVKNFENRDNINIVSKLSYGTDFITINMNKIKNNEIRNAIEMAINKNDLNQVICENTTQVANSIIPPNTFGYIKDTRNDFNLEKAKEIMKKYPNTKINLYIYEDPSKFQMAQMIQGSLKEIGIDVNIVSLEVSAFLQLTAKGEHDALLGLWYTSSGDADYGYYPLLHGSSMGAVGNRSFYNNEEVNRYLDDARKTENLQKRKEDYQKVEEIIRKEKPIIPLLYKTYNIGVRKNVKGFIFNPNGNHILENVEIL